MSAILSPCGTYRYRLDRNLGNGGARLPALFIGVNPSTADATTDDATIRKMKGFCERWGMASFIVVNLFSFRATDVRELAVCIAAGVSPKGFDHYGHVLDAMRECGMIVPCWGDQTKLPLALRGEIDVMRKAIRESGKPTYALGFTKMGDPMHPLMLAYTTQVRTFR